MLVRIAQDRCAWTLNPTAVVDSLLGLPLTTCHRLWVPNRIKRYEDDSNLVLLGHTQELLHAIQEVFSFPGPEQIVEEHPHRVETQALCPAEFQVDPL